MIGAISIRGLDNSIAYECQWIIKEGVKTQWVDEIMVKPQKEVEKNKIGFNNKEI